MPLYTENLSPHYRRATHPEQVLPPLIPAPSLARETTLLEDGKTLLEKDIAIKMRDGVTLYANLYRPDSKLVAQTPTIVLFAPFGKHGAVPRERFENMAVDFSKLSRHAHWKLPDPLRWCGDWGFSLLVVDPRGTWWSEGVASNHLSPEEGRDGYDIVEWIAKQDWSTGNVGWGGGVSYFAMSAYQVAVLEPPHLKALIIWEGISDLYREVNLPGGIPNVPFQHFWMNMTGNGLNMSEDHAVASIEHPLFDEYWQSKVVDWSLIKIPTFSVTGWSSLGLHLRGTVDAWKAISSENKYLLIHGGREWSEFYKEENVTKQRLFWDRFLKNQPNEVDEWPRVELDVRTSATQNFRRAEPDFPPRAQLTEYYLTLENKLQVVGDDQSKYVSFEAHKTDSMAFFDIKIDKPTEISGYSSVTLFVQAMHFPDVDLFVALQKIDKNNQCVKFYHSIQMLEADTSFGWLRASHRELDDRKSKPERPIHLHRKRLWLTPKDVAEVNIELWPTSTVWEAGDTLRLAIKGNTFTNSDNFTQFKGPSHSFGE
ncbi:family hydrolase, partial [Fusarium beomiforme]